MCTQNLAVIKPMFIKQYTRYFVSQRNVQVSIIGAAGDVGSNLSLLIKRNPKVTSLNLFDNSERVLKFSTCLNEIPGGPIATGFTGNQYLSASICNSNLIIMVSRISRRLSYSREQMLAINAPTVHKVCKTIAEFNPNAFLAISTNPINSIIPFVSALLQKHKAYDSSKLFGITHIDTARAKAITANYLHINPRQLYIPVIGGHSDDTIIPLYSNITPIHYAVDIYKADTLTRLLRKAGTQVISNKIEQDSATLAMAWSINECAENLIEALCGNKVVVNSYTLNPNFGTRYFSGPTQVGCHGIVEMFRNNLEMNEYEKNLLKTAVPLLNDDISRGEQYVNVMYERGFHK